MIMAYKILYIEDQDPSSRISDFEELGFNVNSFDPSSDISKILDEINQYQPSALVIDYKLTEGVNNACYDAPTIAQTLRSRHSFDHLEIPIILMSNQEVITEYYKKDFTSQDLFDFTFTKKEFNDNKKEFGQKLKSFIRAYEKIKITDLISADFETINSKIATILNVENDLIHSRITLKLLEKKDNVFSISNFIYSKIIRSIGVLIGEDLLSARLGISKTSVDWDKVLESLNNCAYTGVFSDIHHRWWMNKVDTWWKETINSETPLRRLNAAERVAIIKDKLLLDNLLVVEKTPQSKSTNFWTICKHSNAPIDPFDGIELLKEYLPWQEKEYLSFDSALEKLEDFKNLVSQIDKKAVRELVKKLRAND